MIARTMVDRRLKELGWFRPHLTKTGVCQSYCAEILSAKRRPPMGWIAKCATLIGVDETELRAAFEADKNPERTPCLQEGCIHPSLGPSPYCQLHLPGRRASKSRYEEERKQRRKGYTDLTTGHYFLPAHKAPKLDSSHSTFVTEKPDACHKCGSRSLYLDGYATERMTSDWTCHCCGKIHYTKAS